MLTSTRLLDGPVSAALYRCAAVPGQRPFAEQHSGWSASYVQRGSFGCACRGRHFELVPGAVLIGRPGDEYTCTHDHHAGGDECLAFFATPELADELGATAGAWQSGALPPLAELIALGERARHAAAQDDGVGLDEVGLAFVAKVAALQSGAPRAPVKPGAAERRRVVESALWIDAHCDAALDLQQLAQQARWSPYHYLRVFGAVLGVTPHQYLLRSRLRRAARLLAGSELGITDIALAVGFEDLSNFVNTFRRAAGLSPRAWRRLARREHRNFHQDPPTLAD